MGARSISYLLKTKLSPRKRGFFVVQSSTFRCCLGKGVALYPAFFGVLYNQSMLEILFCLIVGISDGDTLTARCGEPGSYEQDKVNLVAIDAPERRQHYGNRSRQELSDICFQANATIKAHYSDRWGRNVADVECNGVDATRHMLSSGYAWVYDRYAGNHQHLYPLQEEARTARRGLWQGNVQIPPWEWRRNRRSQ